MSISEEQLTNTLRNSRFIYLLIQQINFGSKQGENYFKINFFLSSTLVWKHAVTEVSNTLEDITKIWNYIEYLPFTIIKASKKYCFNSLKFSGIVLL